MRNPTACFEALPVVVISEKPEEGRLKRRWLSVSLALTLALLLLLLFTYTAYFLLWPSGHGVKWDGGRMEDVRLEEIQRLRHLMSRTNASVHDTEARKYLRELAKKEQGTCYKPTCLRTSETFADCREIEIIY